LIEIPRVIPTHIPTRTLQLDFRFLLKSYIVVVGVVDAIAVCIEISEILVSRS